MLKHYIVHASIQCLEKFFLFNLDTTKYEVCHDMVSSVHCYTKITHDMVFFIDVIMLLKIEL